MSNLLAQQRGRQNQPQARVETPTRGATTTTITTTTMRPSSVTILEVDGEEQRRRQVGQAPQQEEPYDPWGKRFMGEKKKKKKTKGPAVGIY